MRSWKTTLAGAVAGLAYAAQYLDLSPTVRVVAQVVVVIGIIALGVLAGDAAALGARPAPPPSPLPPLPLQPGLSVRVTNPEDTLPATTPPTGGPR